MRGLGFKKSDSREGPEAVPLQILTPNEGRFSKGGRHTSSHTLRQRSGVEEVREEGGRSKEKDEILATRRPDGEGVERGETQGEKSLNG